MNFHQFRTVKVLGQAPVHIESLQLCLGLCFPHSRRFAPLFCSPTMAAHLLLSSVVAALVVASPFDPHPFPESPFVEGWFARMVDHDSQLSAAIIMGVFAPDGSLNSNESQTWASILVQRPGAAPITKQATFNGTSGGVVITKNGHPVIAPPVPGAPASFEYSSTQGQLNVTHNGSAADLLFDIDGVKVEMHLSHRVPYNKVSGCLAL